MAIYFPPPAAPLRFYAVVPDADWVARLADCVRRAGDTSVVAIVGIARDNAAALRAFQALWAA